MPKSAPKRGETALHKSRGSGFEDGFADPPMTPSEHAAEQIIYDPNRAFHERIEECIQRFVTRRRMAQDRQVLFQKYLALGGIENTQRQFTGTADLLKDWKDDDYTADEIRGFTADNYLSYDGNAKGKWFNPAYPEHWDVDFAGVVAGFLGTYLPEQGGPNAPEIRLAADTILNFLKYVRHHDVCPEYDDNLAQASRVCELAMTELSRIASFCRDMPGDFNLACRILFCSKREPIVGGGSGTSSTDLVLYEDRDPGEGSGEKLRLPGSWDTAAFAPADFDPERVFKTAIALYEPQLAERVRDLKSKPARVMDTFEDAYEVKEIVFAKQDIEKMYKGLNQQSPDIRPVGPVGYIVLYPTIIEDGWDKRPTLASGRADNPGKPVSLYMDHMVMQHLCVGMKLRLVICELDMGLEFIREVSDVLPSFYTFLPQYLMLHWKPPRPDTRPPPSAEDPGALESHEREDLDKEAREIANEERKFDPGFDLEMCTMEDEKALEMAMERSKV